MKGETEELWYQLAEQAAVEQDSAKLFELVKQINRLLEEKHQLLNQSENSTYEPQQENSG